jgi:hypothetical protein
MELTPLQENYWDTIKNDNENIYVTHSKNPLTNPKNEDLVLLKTTLGSKMGVFYKIKLKNKNQENLFLHKNYPHTYQNNIIIKYIIIKCKKNSYEIDTSWYDIHSCKFMVTNDIKAILNLLKTLNELKNLQVSIHIKGMYQIHNINELIKYCTSELNKLTNIRKMEKEDITLKNECLKLIPSLKKDLIPKYHPTILKKKSKDELIEIIQTLTNQ